MMVMAAAALATTNVTIPGPSGPLAGTLMEASRSAPALILVPGSGPTDRDGNNPAGVAGSVYRQLAEQLAAKGVTTLRIDNPCALTVDASDKAQAFMDFQKSADGQKLYDKWFMQKIPPKGLNLNAPISAELKHEFAKPSDSPDPDSYK